VIYFLNTKAVKPAEPGAMNVFIMAREAWDLALMSKRARDDPALNISQQIQRIKVPRTTYAILFG
jgi:hypothetical protein